MEYAAHVLPTIPITLKPANVNVQKDTISSMEPVKLVKQDGYITKTLCVAILIDQDATIMSISSITNVSVSMATKETYTVSVNPSSNPLFAQPTAITTMPVAHVYATLDTS